MKRLFPLLLLLFVTYTFSQDVSVIAEEADLRGTPSNEGKIVGSVSKDDSLKVIKRNDAWFLVQTRENVGWIRGDVIKPRDVSTEKPRKIAESPRVSKESATTFSFIDQVEYDEEGFTIIYERRFNGRLDMIAYRMARSDGSWYEIQRYSHDGVVTGHRENLLLAGVGTFWLKHGIAEYQGPYDIDANKMKYSEQQLASLSESFMGYRVRRSPNDDNGGFMLYSPELISPLYNLNRSDDGTWQSELKAIRIDKGVSSKAFRLGKRKITAATSCDGTPLTVWPPILKN